MPYIELTFDGPVSSTGCVAGAVADLPGLCRDLVSAPTVLAVGQTHDGLVLLQTDQLAVTGTLEVVGAMVLERGGGLEAANVDKGAGGLGDGGCGNRVFDGGGWCVVGKGSQEYGGRYEGGRESDEDHGCGDGVLWAL